MIECVLYTTDDHGRPIFWVEYEKMGNFKRKGVKIPYWGKLEHAIVSKQKTPGYEEEYDSHKGVWIKLEDARRIASEATATMDAMAFSLDEIEKAKEWIKGTKS